MPLDKGMSPLNSTAKDEREGDHYRPWRSNSSQSRGRGEPPHNQTLTPNKHGPMFSYGRGRGENTPPTFSVGRGRVNSSGSPGNSFSAHSQPLVAISDKGESIHGELSLLRYSRTKLLDVYRTTDMRSGWKLVDEFVQVSQLTEEDSLEPLALSAPTPEESVILKGIDKGDIVSSGAPQISKDGSAGRNSSDFVQSRRSKPGSKEDLALVADDYKDEGVDNSKGGYSNYREGPSREALHSNPDNQFNLEVLREDTGPYRRADELPAKRESSMQGSSSVLAGAAWRSPSIGERSHAASHDVRSNTSQMSWSQPMKDSNEWQGSLANSSYPKNEMKWQVSEDPVIKRLPPGISNREHESRNVPPPSPEDLVLYYKDPQGAVQGPFSGSDIIGWFEAGYFGIDLLVRIASAPNDSPFSLLGDVMPHLRAKGGPPPGFSSPKQNEITDAQSRPSFGSFGKLHGVSSEIDIVKNEPRNLHGSATEAENRFLESLMSANISSSQLDKFAFSEGLQGYIGNNSSGVPPVGVESGNNLYLLAKKMELERQKSLPSPHPYWPGRDAASMVLKPEIVSGSPSPHSKLLPSVSNNPRQQPQAQNADLMAVLHGLSDRSSSGVNNNVASWSNFPVQGGMESLQDKLELHHGQSFPPQAAFGIQQQRLQSQNQPSLTNLLAQTIDNPSGISTTEKLLSSGLSQDPQLLTMLQQQYLMQLQSQAPVPTQQLSLLDKLLLLKQQQKQEEQQQVMRQQQLLSQVLSEHHSLQRFGEPSYGQLPATAIPAGNASLEHPRLPPSQELFQIGSNMPVSNMQDERNTNYSNLPPQVSQDVNFSVEATSLHLPHQMFGNVTRQKSWGTAVPEQTNENQHEEALLLSSMKDGSQSMEVMDRSSQEFSVLPKVGPTPDYASLTVKETSQKTSRTNETVTVGGSEAISEFVPSKSRGTFNAIPSLETCEDKLLTPEIANDVKIKSDGSFEEQHIGKSRCADEPLSTTALEDVEVREVRKASDKKSRKQKASKTHSTSDQAKEVSKIHLQQNRQSEIEETNLDDSAFETHSGTGETFWGASAQNATDSKFGVSAVPASLSGDDVESVDVRGAPKVVESVSLLNKQGQSGQRTWKPAPGFKAKSLLEIQQEEQRKVQTETVVSEVTSSINSLNPSSPWVGVVGNSDIKSSRGIYQNAGGPEIVRGISDNSLNLKSKKSQLHDLLAEEVLIKKEKDTEVLDRTSSIPPQPVAVTHLESIDNENFIEAKDTKKNRKKSAKAKGGAKVSLPIASVDLSVGSSPIDKGKSTRHVQQEKEVMPALPSGPSLGDFVLWKGETANAATAPAWLNDSGKVPKPTSLRDILKEQEKKVSSVQHQSQMLTPQKSQPIQATRGSGPLWSHPASSPSKAASPVQINSHASAHSKYKGDDDLFWGAIDQPKQEAKQMDFPQLASQGSRGTKNTPAKGTPGGSLGRQKSVSGRPAEHSLSSSPASAQSLLKGKRDAMTKHSEAMDFRDWCVSESVRLTGTKDTSFLEFCLKQSRTEAAILLRENLGSFDPDHEFIDKFLNYKELLPADVLEIAFQSRNDRNATSFGAGDVTSDNTGITDFDRDITAGTDGSTKGGSKKKGKKGKKVSPSVLGFNVVSNRIMMGEIQTLED